MKTILKFALRGFPLLCLAFAVAMLCVSCASNPQVMNAATVATIPPNSDGSDLGTHGFLVVNTPTVTSYDERSVRRFPHTGYTIFDTRAGRPFKYVPNHSGKAGETAAMVLLPAGTYLIEARTVYHQPIRFPVIVRPDTQTTVNLESDTPVPKTLKGGFYTIQYHGRAIGWLTESKAM